MQILGVAVAVEAVSRRDPERNELEYVEMKVGSVDVLTMVDIGATHNYEVPSYIYFVIVGGLGIDRQQLLTIGPRNYDHMPTKPPTFMITTHQHKPYPNRP